MQVCHATHFISVIPAIGMYIESSFYLTNKFQTYRAQSSSTHIISVKHRIEILFQQHSLEVPCPLILILPLNYYDMIIRLVDMSSIQGFVIYHPSYIGWYITNPYILLTCLKGYLCQKRVWPETVRFFTCISCTGIQGTSWGTYPFLESF